MNPEIERYSKILLKIGIALVLMITLYFAFLYFVPMFFDVSGFILKGLLPIIIAVVLAILIDPIVCLLEEKKGIERGIATAVVLFLFLLIISVFLLFVISRLVVELSNLYKQLETQNLYEYFLNTIDFVKNYLYSNPLPQEAQKALHNSVNTMVDETANIIVVISNFLFGFLSGLPGVVTIVIVSAIATFFISRDKVQITRFFFNSIPSKFVKPINILIGEVNGALIGFFRAQLILISVTTILTSIGLYIINVDYAITIGMIAGFLDLLPIVGPSAVFLPWALIQIITGKYKLGVALLIIYGIVIGVRQLIEPKILSNNIGLHPLTTLLALYLGLRFIGIWGIIVGPFVIIVIKGITKGLKQQ